MLIDVLSLIAPDPKVLGNNYLSGSTPNITYVGPAEAGLQQLVYMKGLSGFPWDWLTVGQDYIYQRMTENIWGDPSTGKLMFGLGSPRFPRWIDYSYPSPILLPAAVAPQQVPGLTAQLVTPLPTLTIPGQWQFTVDRPHTDYVIYGPNGVPVSRSSDNHVRNTFRGPYPGDAILDAQGKTLLPAGEDWLADYEWGGKDFTSFNILERVYHRKGYGRYGWASYAWRADGNYTTPTASSQTVKIVPLPATLVLPVQKVF